MASTFKWYGERVSAELHAASVIGLNKAAERLKAISVPLAPLRDGFLRASCHVIPAVPADLTSTVVYDTVYARRQHEELTWRHRDGQAKYLERPLREQWPQLEGIIAAEQRRALR